MKSIHSVNFNQISVLHALLETSSTSKAAAKLGISQSAVSHGLRRLRSYYEDPLFVPTTSGLITTDLAEQLRPKVEHAIDSIKKVFFQEFEFDLLKMCDKFRIGIVGGYVPLLEIKAIMDWLTQHNNHSSVEICHLKEGEAISKLLELEFDVVVGSLVQAPTILHKTIFRELALGVLVRSDHP